MLLDLSISLAISLWVEASDGLIPKIYIPIRSRALNINPRPIPSLGPSLWFDPSQSRSDPRSLPMSKLLYKFSCNGFILIILYCMKEFSLFLHSTRGPWIVVVPFYPLRKVLGVLQFLNFCIRIKRMLLTKPGGYYQTQRIWKHKSLNHPDADAHYQAPNHPDS